jgi:hypothetical protein
MKYLITNVTTSEDIYDADVQWYVAKLTPAFFAFAENKINIFKDVLSKDKDLLSINFFGLGYFLGQEIYPFTPYSLDLEDIENLIDETVEKDIWLSSNPQVEKYLQEFGANAEKLQVHTQQTLTFSFVPKHADFTIYSADLSFELVERLKSFV